jgi:GNAT superfamily N-acetyltransferase
MDVTIRRITPDDGELLADLRLRALADAPDAFSSTHAEASRQSADDWTDLARRRAAGHREATFFALLGGAPVGLVGGFVRDGSPLVDLVSMWVAPEARRHGVARALIQAVVDWAHDGGYDEVQLWVTEVNDGARKLYEASGFLATGDVDHLRPGSPLTERRMTRRIAPR